MNIDNGPGGRRAFSGSALAGLRRRMQRLLPAAWVLLALPTLAEVTVRDAWVRGTVPAQTTTGAFMVITSTEDAKLVGVKSSAAKEAQLHTTMMMGGVNHMHETDAVPLPAGKAVELKPGGFHVMLMGVSKPITKGQKVPISLVVEDGKGRRSTVEVKADVRPLGQ